MMIVYVLPHASLCGGVKVIAEHVSGLHARGHAAEVWGLTGDFGWFPRKVPHRRFGSTDDLGQALRVTSAAKVATFWITASWVAPNLLDGERGFYLIQDEDELTYGGSTHGSSYKLGLVNITEGEFVTGEIERKHGVKCHNVGIGVDPKVFRPLPYIRERKRILTALRTTSAGPAGLKGWDVASDSIRKAFAVDPELSLVTFGMEPQTSLGCGIPHIHVQSPSDRKLRELYSQSGMYLSCSRHEGFGLPMLEAMACKCPVVCTDSHGNREFCRDGDTAMVAASEDSDSVAAKIVQVAGDDQLARKISLAGFAESGRYRWSKVLDNLEALFGPQTVAGEN